MTEPRREGPEPQVFDFDPEGSLEIGGMRVVVRLSGDATGRQFALVETTLPAYFPGLRPHLHRRTTEVHYVAQGMLAVRRDEETVVVRQGDLVLVPPGTVHRIWNPTATAAITLTALAPAGGEAFWSALAGLPEDEILVHGEPFFRRGQAYDCFPPARG